MVHSRMILNTDGYVKLLTINQGGGHSKVKQQSLPEGCLMQKRLDASAKDAVPLAWKLSIKDIGPACIVVKDSSSLVKPWIDVKHVVQEV